MKRTNDVQDEFHGVGGSFVIDPVTGLRRRMDEVQPNVLLPNPLPLAENGALPGDVQADAAAVAQYVKTTRSK